MQQQRSVYVYQHWPPCQICGAAVSKLQSGLATAAAHNNTTKKSFLQKIPKDESKRIAKEEIKTDDHDFTERSGRAVKVFSLMIFILVLCFTFCILYVFRY